MKSKEANKELVNDLIYYYVEKKRISNKDYNYISSRVSDTHIAEAAELCEKHGLTPENYIHIVYGRLHGPKEHFHTKHVRGDGVKKHLASLEKEDGYSVELTNANIDYHDIWNHQIDMAKRYMKHGLTTKEILMNSSLKFFGWFRILSTPDRIPDVVDKYGKIAQKELNPRLKEYIKQQGLPMERITG